jgi:predicted O-methyltransferase YrrM
MDERIGKTIHACEAFIATTEDDLSLPRSSAELLHALIIASGATRGLEIGTSYGYSGLWLAAALQTNGGKLTTIEKEQRKSDVAATHFADAGLSNVVTCRVGQAMGIIETLAGPFDFVLNDADKENCQAYVEALLPKMAARGVIVTDNTVSHAAQLDAFCAWARRQRELVSVHLPVGSGMEMTVKK